MNGKVCDKCNGSGLIPLTEDGIIIPYSWVDCDCKEREDNREVALAEDFDFACSRR